MSKTETGWECLECSRVLYSPGFEPPRTRLSEGWDGGVLAQLIGNPPVLKTIKTETIKPGTIRICTYEHSSKVGFCSKCGWTGQKRWYSPRKS